MNSGNPQDTGCIGIATEKLEESRDFYTKHFNYRVERELADTIFLRSSNGHRSIAFFRPMSEKRGAERVEGLDEPFSGKGIYLTLGVPDVNEALAYFQREGIAIARELRVEAWGERLFMIRDPNGVGIFMSEHPTQA